MYAIPEYRSKTTILSPQASMVFTKIVAENAKMAEKMPTSNVKDFKKLLAI